MRRKGSKGASRRGRGTLAAAGLLVLHGWAAGQESHPPTGPLDVWPQSPLHDLRLGHLPRPVRTLDEGRTRVSFATNWVNIWNQRQGDLQVDYETLETVVAGAHGLGQGLEIEVFYRQRNRFGGVLDSLIETWHDLFGLSQNGRDDFASDEVVIEIPATATDPAVSTDVVGTLNEDLGLRLQQGLAPWGRRGPELGWAATVLWHAGGDNELEGPRDLDFGATLLVGDELTRDLHGQLDLSYHWLGSESFAGLDLERRNFSAFASLEWTCSAKTSVVLQYLWTDQVARTRFPYDQAAHEIALGLRRRTGPDTWFELALIENAFRIDNSPDFGLHFGLVTHL